MSFKLKNLISGGILTLMVAGVTGCGDKPEPVKPPTSTPAAPTTAPSSVSVGTPAVQTAVSAPPPTGGAAMPLPGATPAGGAPTAAAEEVPSKDALDAVTKAVQSFFINKERAPKNLEELVASGFLKKLPAPPAGKKYVYDPEKANITLADQ